MSRAIDRKRYIKYKYLHFNFNIKININNKIIE